VSGPLRCRTQFILNFINFINYIVIFTVTWLTYVKSEKKLPVQQPMYYLQAMCSAVNCRFQLLNFLRWIYPLMEWNLKSRHYMKVIIISVLYTKTTWVHKRNNKLPNFLQLHNCSSEYMKNHIFEYLNFPVCFIAQLVEHCNGLGSSPIQPDFFFRL